MKSSSLNRFGICLMCECSVEENRQGCIFCEKCQKINEDSHTHNLSGGV